MTRTRERPSIQPRGLCREDAAAYVGLSPTKFDELVGDGRMPRPKRVDGRVIWDRYALDAYFSDLPDDSRGNAIDRLLAKGSADSHGL